MNTENAKRAYESFTGGTKADGGKHFVSWDALSPAGQGAWQAAVDAARDSASTEEQKNDASAGNREVAMSRDPNVKNQDPTGAQRK